MLSYPKIKFCGLTNNEDVACAYEQKAYWAGFIFEKGSSRYIEFEKSKNIIAQFKDKIKFVGVFVNPSNDYIEMGINSPVLTEIDISTPVKLEVEANFNVAIP